MIKFINSCYYIIGVLIILNKLLIIIGIYLILIEIGWILEINLGICS